MKKYALLVMLYAITLSSFAQFGPPPNPVLQKIQQMGYDISTAVELNAVYLIEGDLVFSKNIHDYPKVVAFGRQVHTQGLVSDVNFPIRIFSFLSEPGIPNPPSYRLGLQNAVNLWNNARGAGCGNMFQIVEDINLIQEGDIIVRGPDQIPGGWPSGAAQRFGNVSGAPFCGNPVRFVDINTDFVFNFNPNNPDPLGVCNTGISNLTSGPPDQTDITNIFTHELGHAIGFLHTDVDGIEIPGTNGNDINSIMHSNMVNCRRNYTTLSPDDITSVQYLYGCSSTVNDNASNNGQIIATQLNDNTFCDDGKFDISGTYDNCTGGSATIQLCFEELGATGTSQCSQATVETFSNGTFNYPNLDSSIIPNFVPGIEYYVTARLTGNNPATSNPQILNGYCGGTGSFCNQFPKEYDLVNYKNGVIAVDNENSVIYGGATLAQSGFALEGLIYTYGHFLSKFKSDGCLDFVIGINGIFEMKVDDQNDIYYTGESKNSLHKVSDGGSPLWTYSDFDLEMHDFDHGNGEVLILVTDNNTGNMEIHRLNANNGNLIEIEVISNTGTVGFNSFSKIVTAKNSSNFYVSLFMDSGSISFGSNTINHDGNNTDVLLLKYNVVSNSIAATTSYEYIDTGVPGTAARNNIYYNGSTSHLLIIRENVLSIYDQNLNSSTDVTLPFIPFGAFYESNFNETINMFSVVKDGNLYKIEDQSPYTVQTVALNSNVTSLFSNIFGLNTNHALGNDNKAYLAGQSVNSINSGLVSKVDANTGDNLTFISNNDDLNVVKTKVHPASTVSIYPNPFNSTLLIRDKNDKTIYKVFIYDKFGNIVTKQESKGKSYYIEMNTSRLSKGMYFVQTFFSDGTSEVKQILKE